MSDKYAVPPGRLIRPEGKFIDGIPVIKPLVILDTDPDNLLLGVMPVDEETFQSYSEEGNHEVTRGNQFVGGVMTLLTIFVVAGVSFAVHLGWL